MKSQIIPERLAMLPEIHFDNGSHESFAKGHCVLEVSAWLAGEPHSDRPSCVSPVLRSYTMRLNDRWDDDRRQTLKPYAARIIGTAGDGQDAARIKIARQALLVDLLPAWLVPAGMDDEAASLPAMVDLSDAELRVALYKVRDAAWPLGESQHDVALALLDRLIDPSSATS